MKSGNLFMKHGLFLSFSIYILSITLLSAEIPEDLNVIALAGGTSPMGEVVHVQIHADGKMTYISYYPDAIDLDPIAEDSTILNESALNQIWQAIQTNQPLHLAPADRPLSDQESHPIRYVQKAPGHSQGKNVAGADHHHHNRAHH